MCCHGAMLGQLLMLKTGKFWTVEEFDMYES